MLPLGLKGFNSREEMEQTAGRKRPPLEAFAKKTLNSKVKVLKETLEFPSYTAPWRDIFRESTVSFLICRRVSSLTAEACNRKWNVSCLAVPMPALRKVGLRFFWPVQLAVSVRIVVAKQKAVTCDLVTWSSRMVRIGSLFGSYIVLVQVLGSEMVWRFDMFGFQTLVFGFRSNEHYYFFLVYIYLLGEMNPRKQCLVDVWLCFRRWCREKQDDVFFMGWLDIKW